MFGEGDEGPVRIAFAKRFGRCLAFCLLCLALGIQRDQSRYLHTWIPRAGRRPDPNKVWGSSCPWKPPVRKSPNGQEHGPDKHRPHEHRLLCHYLVKETQELKADLEATYTIYRTAVVPST